MWFIISIVALSALAIALLRMDRSRPRRKAIERRQYFRQPTSFYHTDFGRALAHVPFEAVAYVVVLLLLGALAASLPPYGGNYRDCWLAEYFSWWPLIAIGVMTRLTCFIGQFMGRGKGKLDAMETISWLAPIIALALGFLAAYPVFSEAAPSLRSLDFFYGVQVPGEAMADAWACWIQTGDSVGCGQ